MNDVDRVKVLRILLIVVGLIFVFGVWPLTVIWPSGWAWHTEGRSEYLEMIMGIYATLGVFLLIASRDPLAHRSLIWFTVWSSVVHSLVMAGSAVRDRAEAGHLVGDVPALLLLAIALGVVARRAETETPVTRLAGRRAA